MKVLTYSSLALFRNCRRAFRFRYVDEIVPQREDDDALGFGTLIHDCLEHWHADRDLTAILARIDAACPLRGVDERQRKTWHHATAMMKGYAARYPVEDFVPVALEHKFEGAIINPRTGAKSRALKMAGKCDGIVKIGDATYLLEHKTAARVDGDYLERLWCDLQIHLYSAYIEQTMGTPVSGVIYNVLCKPTIRQGAGETEAEFEARRADLLSKSTTGKTSAKRKVPESDDDYQARLAAFYATPEAYHREMLYLSRDQIDAVRGEIWDMAQAVLDARRKGSWYQNTSYCFNWNRPCDYFALCRSNNSPIVRDNFYKPCAAHSELRDSTTQNTAAEPVF